MEKTGHKGLWRLVLVAFVMLTGVAQGAMGGTREDSLRLQRQLFPQEKVFVMTDRELYLTGDTVWLRAWVVDGQTYQRSPYSEYLYVELRDMAASLVKRVRLKADQDGLFTGYLDLDASLHSNSYTLVAYTYYMVGMSELFFFKKIVDVLDPDDVLKGLTTKSLKEQTAPEDVTLVNGGSRIRVSLPVPQGSRYGVSVTNLSMNPRISDHLITQNLPSQRNLFEAQDITPDWQFVKPRQAVEQGNVMSGTVYGNFFTKKPQKNVAVTVVGHNNKFFKQTVTDEQGRFLVDLPNRLGMNEFLVQARSKHTVKTNITFDQLALPDTILPLRPGRGHFVKANVVDGKAALEDNTRDWASLGRMRRTVLLDAVEVKGRKRDEGPKPSDWATRVQYIDNEDGVTFTTYMQLLFYMGCDIRDDRVFFHNKGVSIYVDDFPQMDADISFLESCYPIETVKFVEVLDATASLALMGRGTDSNPYVLHVHLKTGQELAEATSADRDFKTYRCDGGQQPKKHGFIADSASPSSPLIMWNAARMVTPDGVLSFDLPVPDNSGAIYRIVAEGISPDGQPVCVEKYLKVGSINSHR